MGEKKKRKEIGLYHVLAKVGLSLARRPTAVMWPG